jgi:hypothetical protein
MDGCSLLVKVAGEASTVVILLFESDASNETLSVTVR